MSVLEDYFRQTKEDTFTHPLLHRIDEAMKRADVEKLVVEVLRPKDVLGFKAAKLYLHMLDEAGHDPFPPLVEAWDDALNTDLVKRNIRAVSIANETVRFTLSLRSALQIPEIRFGDGYFNAVLVDYIEKSPFADHPAVKPVLKHVYRSGTETSSQAYAECSNMIDATIRGRAVELVNDLKYDQTTAIEILAAAIGQYLDERFSVTNRRNLGLL